MENIEDVEERLARTIQFNAAWYQRRASRSKWIHTTLQVATVLLPLVTMLVELNFHILSLNLTLLLLVSALAAINVAVSPQQSWRRFKVAEMEITALGLTFDAERSNATLSEQQRRDLVVRTVAAAKLALRNVADQHFDELERRLASIRL
jgi:hypothetical protein